MGKLSVVSSENVKFTPVFSESFIEFQIKDLEIRKKELEFKKIQNENNYEFAKNSLKLQSEDLKNQRDNEMKKEKNSQNISLILIILLFTLILTALFMDKDEILLEIGKIAGYIFGGGITGYGIALQKTKIKSKVTRSS